MLRSGVSARNTRTARASCPHRVDSTRHARAPTAGALDALEASDTRAAAARQIRLHVHAARDLLVDNRKGGRIRHGGSLIARRREDKAEELHALLHVGEDDGVGCLALHHDLPLPREQAEDCLRRRI